MAYRQAPLPTAAKPYLTVPPSVIVTQFQSGHGFTTSGADGSSNLNDTSNFVIGTQAATMVTAGAGATTFLLHKGLTAADMTSRQYVLVVECDDPTHILTGDFAFMAGTGASSGTTYQWQLYSASDEPQNVIQAGRWTYYVLNFADATVNGSPVRTAITDYYVKANDDSTGNKVTIRVNAIYAIPDSSGLAPYGRSFPNGAATICFDDGFISQATNAKPVLDTNGLNASMFIIWDQIGLSNRLTQAQLLAFQDICGWDINAHSLTDADHSAAFNNLTAAELESNFANQQQIMASQGFQGQGTAYPKGEVTTTALGLIRKYFQYARGTFNKTLETLPVADMFNLRAISSISPLSGGYSPASISQANGVIDETAAQHRWLILTFHKIIGNVTSCNNTTGTTYRIVYTDTSPPYNTGNSLTLQGFSPSGLNGTYTVTADGTTGGFGYAEVSIPANPGSASVQGTALSATTDCDLASYTAIVNKLVSSGVAILNMADMMKCLYPEPASIAGNTGAIAAVPVSTTAETVVASVTMPAGMPAGASFRVTAWGSISIGGTGGTFVSKCRVGGLSGAQIASASSGSFSSSGTGFWLIDAVVTLQTTGGSATWSGVDRQQESVSGTNSNSIGAGTATASSLISEAFAVTVALSSSTSSVSCLGSSAERIA